MEVIPTSQIKEGLCGGKQETADEMTQHSSYLKDINSNIPKHSGLENEVMSEPRTSPSLHQKSKSTSFLQRIRKLRIRRNPSTASYDLGSDMSNRSSIKEDCLSENEDKFDGIDSGIASEAGDCPPSSTLSSCTNYTGSSFGDRVPGILGIHNFGNTCYMNAVLQCLAHIDPVVEYFAMDKYRDDMKQRRKIFKSRKLDNCAKGKLTDLLAELLKSLWTFGYSKELGQAFKDAVSKYGEQYRGTSQQDAQEFLLWLLDFIHEDLCKSPGWSFYNKSSANKKKKQYTEEEQAARTLASHCQQNKSFIKNIFQAQYKSSIACPNCNTCSSTFDPFLCISLPIPQKETKPMYMTMIYPGNSKPPSKFGVSVPHCGTVRDLKATASKLVDIPEDRLILALVYEDGDQCSLHDESMVDSIPEMDDCLFVIQAPPRAALKSLPEATSTDKSASEGQKLTETARTPQPKAAVDGLAANFQNRMQLPLLRDGDNDSVIIVVTNVELKGKRYRRFGFPITLRVSRNVSFKDLQILIRREMPTEIRSAINTEAKSWKLILGLRVVGGQLNNDYLKESDVRPLRQPTVERALITNLSAGPPHISIVAEWEPESQEWCLAKYGQGHAVEHESVKLLEEEYSEGQDVTLNDCLELHTKEEELQYEDSWTCPNCKIDVNRTTKKLCLWSLPDVLVVHLKRFQQANHWKGKISADVQFPLKSLDMGPHLASRSQVSPRLAKKYSNSKKHAYSPPPDADDCIYDLFAVCNHIGPYITSGHYTAYCKNSANENWYCFDDSNVYGIDEEQVCTRSAYLVFYQKRNAVSRSASSMSLSSVGSHWSQYISTPQLNTESER